MNGHSKYAVYSCKEKLLLAQLVKENGVIENKRTDGATVLEKKAWECIANTYNSQPEVNHLRTPEQLKKLWNNLKQRKRKDTTALRYSMLATGGGPMEKPKPDVVLDFLDDAAPYLDVSIDCPWDSTQVFENGQTEAKSMQEETAEKDEILLKAQLPALQDVSDPRLLPSTSKSKFSTPKTKRVAEAILTENEGRIKKLDDATQQQQELHAIKKQIAEEELLRVKSERERAELQKQAAEFDRQRAVFDRQRASDEAELASLKLKQFRKRMLSDDL